MRPALWTATALAVGILTADWLRPHPALVLVAILAPILWALADTQRRVWAVLALVALSGAARYAFEQTAGRGDLAVWTGRQVPLTGTVVSEPEVKGFGISYVIQVEQVGEHPAAGRVHLTQRGDRAPAYGERIRAMGTLKTPMGPRTPGGFDQAAYLSRQRVYHVLETPQPELLGPGALDPLRRAAVSVRLSLESVLRQNLPERSAAILSGLLFGSRSQLPEDVNIAFRETGVFHLLSVSGGHLALIIMPLPWLLRMAGVPRRWAAGLTIPAVLFFILLTGATASVTRAGFMTTLVLLGEVLRREKDALNTLGAAAAIVLLLRPSLLFDIGFQFSVAATLGILRFARPIQFGLQPWLVKRLGTKLGYWVAAGLSVTLAAQVMVEPIGLHYFGATSIVAPLTNLLMALLLAPAIYAGLLTVAAGLLSGWLAWPLAVAAHWGVTLLVGAVQLVSLFPWAYVEVGRLPQSAVLAWYGAVVMLAVPSLRTGLGAAWQGLGGWWRSGRRARSVTVICTALALLTAITWRIALSGPPDTMTVTFLDVGQGDALVIQAPGGRTILVDGGPAVEADPAKGRRGYDAGEEVIVPFLARAGVKRLDLVVLSHAHQDHAGGLPAVLAAVRVGQILDPGMASDAPAYRALLEQAASKQTPVTRPTAGDQIQLGPDLVLRVLHPQREFIIGSRSDLNSNSVVLLLQYRQVRILLTGDLEAIAEDHLVRQGVNLRADVLKVAHHGSGHSSTEPFLHAVGPKYAVISMGRGNLFGHPHRDTLARLEEAGTEVFRTDLHGHITVKTDGLVLSVRTERSPQQDGQVGVAGRRLIFAW